MYYKRLDSENFPITLITILFKLHTFLFEPHTCLTIGVKLKPTVNDESIIFRRYISLNFVNPIQNNNGMYIPRLGKKMRKVEIMTPKFIFNNA